MGRTVVAAVVFAAGAGPAGAVSIVDETCEANGGSAEDVEAGFAAHIALAHEPQFGATVKFLSASDEGELGNAGSGVRIGNGEDGNARVLVSAYQTYVGDEEVKPDAMGVWVESTDELNGVMAIDRHPDFDEQLGGQFEAFDIAMLTLDGPMRIWAMRPPSTAVSTKLGATTRAASARS